MSTPPILLTGCAGFIGFHLSRALLARGHAIVGADSLNDYYSVELKKNRLANIPTENFVFRHLDLASGSATRELFEEIRPKFVIHLAAQAGVRYSKTNPQAYVDSNLQGFMNILECCRHLEVEHLLFASSSSVYGGNKVLPFSTCQSADHPVSLYAATKKANELLAHSYASMYGLPATGLRFFTVYGPWGRPDMALYTFAEAIMQGRPIEVFNYGKMRRDFTYVDDIVSSIEKLLVLPPKGRSDWNGELSTSFAPFRVFNIGNNQPVELGRFIELIEENLGRQAVKDYQPIQVGDVPATYADIDELTAVTGFRPSTPIEVGIKRSLEWYKEYHGIR
jgi:UDP-glucuronate 4-epimerase